MKRQILLIVLSILLSISSCSKNLCDVEETKINSRDIEFRKKGSEVYYPGSGRDYVALAQTRFF